MHCVALFIFAEPFRLPCWLSWNRICLQCERPWFDSWVGKIRWRRDRLPTPVFSGFPVGSAGEESDRNVGDLGSIRGLGDTLEKGTTTHSSTLAWRIPWTVYLWGRKELYMTEWLSLSLNMPLHAGIYFIWSIPCYFQGLGILFNAVMLWKEAGSWSRT